MTLPTYYIPDNLPTLAHWLVSLVDPVWMESYQASRGAVQFANKQCATTRAEQLSNGMTKRTHKNGKQKERLKTRNKTHHQTMAYLETKTNSLNRRHRDRQYLRYQSQAHHPIRNCRI
jgi:hypothetical protein